MLDMEKPSTIYDIIKGAKKYLPQINEQRVMRAYEFAKKAHEGQTRNSGVPYIQHPMEAAKILLSLHPDEDSIVTSLLHDVLEDTEVTLDEITKVFGKQIAPLLTGLEKLGKVYYRGEDRQVENLRKMFIAMAKDIRVILIKLADRLHNMRTLECIPEHKRERIAKETLTIYSPIATRLGIYKIKNELDDLCFKYLYSEDYERVTKELNALTSSQQNTIKNSKKVLTDQLKKAHINAVIEGRVKHAYSIYKKLKRKGKNYVSELYDVLALRVVVEDEAQCYQALGIIHKNWTPLATRFKDYIAVPKANGYQSLHTTLIGLCPSMRNQPIEIQIRTNDMNLVAKYGIAAHWQYKEVGGSSVAVSQDKLNWVQSLVDLHESLKSNAEFIESLNVDLFQDRIFVLTPEGDVFDLPADATPIDFAYHIHTDVGHRCRGAKVNGQIVPLNYHLKNGQVVDIIAGNEIKPNRYWLSFVVTSHAKQCIKQWLNSQDRDNLIKTGKEMLNGQLKRFGQKPLNPNLTLLRDLDGEKLTIRERESILEKIGNGSVDVVAITRKIIPEESRTSVYPEKQIEHTLMTEGVQFEDQSEILITGEKGYKTQIASCCNPKPGNMIIGYITRGRGVTIHQENCRVIKGLESKRLIKASWGTQKSHEFVAKLSLERRSRIGLLRDVAEVFASNQLPIIDIENIRHEGTDLGQMLISASFDNLGTLHFVMDQLKNIPGIFSVKECK
ncbi:(p)ppGpp synthetase [Candidatus Peregrinibacteria bacterium CG_4_10_14_0_2_um_filter_43_11]|nr:MAG: (p)ppGpp synthetase [Candidatus Peregrinibacteria bacterium CG_4_10_14_0_2_um_filter_43_11]